MHGIQKGQAMRRLVMMFETGCYVFMTLRARAIWVLERFPEELKQQISNLCFIGGCIHEIA